MTTWQWLSLMGVVAIHVAGSFMWAGRIGTVVSHLADEVGKLRESKHDHANRLTMHGMDIDMLKDDVDELRQERNK